MTLYRAPVQSDLPLAPVWRALARHNIGVNHYRDADGWHIRVSALRKVKHEWTKIEIARATAQDDLGVLLAVLPQLPGVEPRLALLSLLIA